MKTVAAMLRRSLCVALALCAIVAPVSAAELGHTSTVVTTQQTTTNTTYTDVSGASISSANLTAGKKYLVLLAGDMSNSNGSLMTSVRAVHGSTAFAESEQQNVNSQRTKFQFVTVWEAVASEDLKLEFQTQNTGTAQHIRQSGSNK